jgi:RecA/RadA recombinase
MAKQAIKKKDVSEITHSDKLSILRSFKQSTGLDKVKQKEQDWLVLPKAFEEATQCPGIPLNTVSSVQGHTNVGKSTFVFEVIKACQEREIVPVVFDLENAFQWAHAKDIGVNVAEYVDEETGEIEYGPSDDMIYYDTVALYEQYGLYDHDQNKYLQKANREVYVIEDVALCIRELIAKQRADELPFDMMFIIDSIGVGDCYQAAVKRGSNNMWFAGALSRSFNVICNDLIPSTKNVNSKYNNSMFYVNKVWVQTNFMGIQTAKTKGGDSLKYATRFSIFLGNQSSSGTKKFNFSYKGENYEYGIKVNISINKNHITDIMHDGEICSTKNGLCSKSEIDSIYKDQYKKWLVSELKKRFGDDVNEKDLTETETDSEE